MNTYMTEIVLYTAPKVKIKVDFMEKERVGRSLYYICNQMWDKFDSSIQTLSTIFEHGTAPVNRPFCFHHLCPNLITI